MSVNYAAGLSNFPHIHKGKCGLPEIKDSAEVLEKGIKQLVEMVRQSKHMIIHTGAGISTTAGIPDFRGPKGVWTLEMKGEAPKVNINFDEAIPTKTHMAILALQQHGIVKYVVSQNIDGLHMRSGYPRSQLSELHGNMFTEKCEKCGKEYYRRTPVSTMTQKRTGNVCTATGKRGLSNCRGKLRDTILDWEDSLPTLDLDTAENETKKSDLSLCLGTTLQIVPSGKIPLFTLKNGGKLAIVNLQKTKYDKKANLLIHAYVDDVMEGLLNGLGIKIPEYRPDFYLSLLDNLPDDLKIESKCIKLEDDCKGVVVKKKEKESDSGGRHISCSDIHDNKTNISTDTGTCESPSNGDSHVPVSVEMSDSVNTKNEVIENEVIENDVLKTENCLDRPSNDDSLGNLKRQSIDNSGSITLNKKFCPE